jgi:hypothetical protein
MITGTGKNYLHQGTILNPIVQCCLLLWGLIDLITSTHTACAHAAVVVFN